MFPVVIAPTRACTYPSVSVAVIYPESFVHWDMLPDLLVKVTVALARSVISLAVCVWLAAAMPASANVLLTQPVPFHLRISPEAIVVIVTSDNVLRASPVIFVKYPESLVHCEIAPDLFVNVTVALARSVISLAVCVWPTTA